jgi:hypothetical protein
LAKVSAHPDRCQSTLRKKETLCTIRPNATGKDRTVRRAQKDGRIQDSDSYGRDPFPARDRTQ